MRNATIGPGPWCPGGTLSCVHHHPANTVTGPVHAAPAHAARPLPPRIHWVAVLGAVTLLAIAVGAAALRSAHGPVHSNPSSAQFMKDDPTSAPALSTRHP